MKCKYHVGFKDPNCIHCRYDEPVRLPAHGLVRWLIDGCRITAVCRCGTAFVDGTRFIKGNPDEALARLKVHVSENV